MEAYYAVLCERGFLDYRDVLQGIGTFGTPYIGHPNCHLNGVEVNSGSLGHGLPVGTGMALAAKMDESPSRTYVVTGDGEWEEGSNWEAAMAAAQYGLDNLCLVIDRNRLQNQRYHGAGHGSREHGGAAEQFWLAHRDLPRQ